MIRSTLGVVLLGLACAGNAGAQSRYADYYRQTYGEQGDAVRADRGDDGRDEERDGGNYDYARVVRVDPIIAQPPPSQQRCEERDADDGYTSGGRYEDGNGSGTRQSTPGGRVASTIAGGVLGAVVGSQFGGGTGRVLGTAVGTAAGTAAGQSVYDNSHTTRGTVRVCEPVPDRRVDGDVEGYDVTYEYAGRDYHTRTAYHPGDRIRVRVDVAAVQN